MAKNHGSSVKDDKTYAALRDKMNKGEFIAALRDH